MTLVTLAPVDVVALVGGVIIFCRGTIFARVRRVWPVFLGCALCIGFWTGAIATVLLDGFRVAVLLTAFAHGMLIALVALFADATLVRLLGSPQEEPGP